MVRPKLFFLSLLFAVSLITLTFAQAQDATQLQIEAKALLDAKDYPGALAKFQTILSQYPESNLIPESLFYTGKCYILNP